MPKVMRRTFLITTVSAFLLFPLSLAFAAPPYSPYLPGETMAPDCEPGDAYCTVSTTTPFYNSSTETIGTTNLNVTNATTTSLWVGTLTGVLRALGGQVMAGLVNLATEVSGILPISSGGTGTSTTPSLGSILIGNASGGYNLISTSTLGLPSFSDLHSPISLSGQNYLTLDGQNLVIGQVNLSSSNATGTLASTLLSGAYSGQLSFSNPSNTFFGSGAGLTLLNAGNISTGTIGVAFGGTGLSSYVKGSMLYASATNTLSLLSVGSLGNILLVSDQGVPVWTSTSSLGVAFEDLVGMASQSQIPLDLEISGGSINNTSIGINTPGAAVFTGVTTNNSTTTSARTGSLVVTGIASTSVLNVSGTLSLGSGSGILKASSGAVSAVATSAVSLLSDVSGTLAPSNGGTGLVNIQAGAILYGNGTNALATTSAGVGGQVLSYVGGLPTWVATTTFSGALSYSGGNVTINAGAIANNLLANSSVNVSAGTGLSGGGSTALGGTATLSLNTATSNYWTNVQSFTTASTSLLSVRGIAYFGTTATSSFDTLGRLTLANIGANAILSVNAAGMIVASSTPTVTALIASSTSATSTFAGGLTVGDTKLVVDRVTGNVGIGGNPGSSALSVVGKISASLGFNGTCYTGLNIIGFTLLGCNQDVAEVYASYELTEPGEIVALPPRATQIFDEYQVAKVGKAKGLSGETILGVVSMNPGLVFNNGQTYLAGANDQLVSENRTVVALAGRVPVKVSLENGPISAGDKLTISSTLPGVAVKTLGPGMVVGTALQAYEGGGTPMVLMFVDLHWYPGEDTDNGLLDTFSKAVKGALEKVGVFMTDGVAVLRGVSTDKVQTDELCIEEVCIRKDQLENLLQQSSLEPVPVTTEPLVPDPEPPVEESLSIPAENEAPIADDQSGDQ